ncbi:MAG TPA: LacI family DNA-binding transcriptional regulator [Microbacteriaceae bacterium]|nr:LacI family DNA-binding transcriptional regulator [Microbacteriaceae bacterium]
MRHVTISEIARQLGISTASASYALNGRPGVSETTRKRVLDLAARLDWRPSSSARALSRSRSDTIGMVLKRDPDLLGSEPYYMSLLRGVEDVLSEAGQGLLLRMVGAARGADIAVYRRWAAERRVDGVIVLDLAVDDPRPELLHELGMPFVLHGIRLDPETGEQVVEDLVTDARIIVDHMAELGHRRIVYITGPLFLAHEVRRRRAVAAEAARHGIDVIFAECDYTSAGAERLMRERAAGWPQFTGVVSSNDVMALGVVTALRDLKADRFALVSWDDSLLCNVCVPGITALARHPEVQGRRSARLLLQVLDGRELLPEPPIPSSLVIRDTSVAAAFCGPLGVAAPVGADATE